MRLLFSVLLVNVYPKLSFHPGCYHKHTRTATGMIGKASKLGTHSHTRAVAVPTALNDDLGPVTIACYPSMCHWRKAPCFPVRGSALHPALGRSWNAPPPNRRRTFRLVAPAARTYDMNTATNPLQVHEGMKVNSNTSIPTKTDRRSRRVVPSTRWTCCNTSERLRGRESHAR